MTELRTASSGLVPAIVQDRLTGQVRSLVWTTPDALAAASRDGQLRLVGKDGAPDRVVAITAAVSDCDGDAVLVLVEEDQSVCATGHISCFADEASEPSSALPFLGELGRTISERRSSTTEQSYTKSLLEAGPGKVGEKLREEADELALAVAGESGEHVASEAADVLYHLLVALELRGVALRTVIEVLARRSGTSGHREKASRPSRKDG